MIFFTNDFFQLTYKFISYFLYFNFNFVSLFSLSPSIYISPSYLQEPVFYMFYPWTCLLWDSTQQPRPASPFPPLLDMSQFFLSSLTRRLNVTYCFFTRIRTLKILDWLYICFFFFAGLISYEICFRCNFPLQRLTGFSRFFSLKIYLSMHLLNAF